MSSDHIANMIDNNVEQCILHVATYRHTAVYKSAVWLESLLNVRITGKVNTLIICMDGYLGIIIIAVVCVLFSAAKVN